MFAYFRYHIAYLRSAFHSNQAMLSGLRILSEALLQQMGIMDKVHIASEDQGRHNLPQHAKV
jgi:hypothetical protein